jgi:E1A/CREB-binding protein
MLLFQCIDGVDVLMFAMYVHEYGADCPAPNNRVTYISYLDSVKYFQPPVYRTVIFQEILIAYFADAKRRGYHRGYIWACPPQKGDDYILYCHPEEQKTPKTDMLRRWYITISDDCKKEGIVMERTNFYDEHMCPQPGTNPDEVLDVTRMPYLDGDYWPGVAEDILNDMQKEQSKGVSNADTGALQAMKRMMVQHLGVVKQPIPKSGKKGGPVRKGAAGLKQQKKDEDLLVDAFVPRTQLLERLCDQIKTMKEEFLVLHFYPACKYCRNLVTEGTYWNCSSPAADSYGFEPTVHTICTSCYESEDGSLEGLECTLTTIAKAPATTTDEDAPCRSAFFDTRQAYLALCQGNHYQYDQIRRAKHSSMMTLYHLHNPNEPSFVHNCNMCTKEIQGDRYHCDTCKDYDICMECYVHQEHKHKLTFLKDESGGSRNAGGGGGGGGDASGQPSKQDRRQSVILHMRLLLHAASCQNRACANENCPKMKQLLKHGAECKVRATGGCNLCKRVWTLLQIHAKQCSDDMCKVPRCVDLRKHHQAQRAAAYGAGAR